MQSLNDLWFGVTKHKAKTATYIFTCFSVIFTIVKSLRSSSRRFRSLVPVPYQLGSSSVSDGDSGRFGNHPKPRFELPIQARQ